MHMRIADQWQTEYALLDCANGERLERWADFLLIRPDPQVVWQTAKTNPLWQQAHARYHRSAKGGGSWEVYRSLPERWQLSFGSLRFHVKCMGFKHTGVFPEQAVNWDMLAKLIKQEKRPLRVLNLFAYTGAATLACLAAGASVTHVDASRGMVSWAKENALLSGLAQKDVRWMVDDCMKFVQREQRRGSTYDIIIMDPPSYGRGPGGEVWKLEDAIHPLIADCAKLLSENALAFLVNSYTAGLSPSVMEYLLGVEISARRGGTLACDEIGLPVKSSGLTLPCGASAIWFGEREWAVAF